VTQGKKGTIETFCRELALALHRITGKSIDIQPDQLSASIEDNQQPGCAQIPLEDHNDLHIQ
jgi:hypothetical protein